jgi:hypothetical protein
MSLITGNKVKKHTSQGEKEKDKANKRILRSLSFVYCYFHDLSAKKNVRNKNDSREEIY